MMQGKGQNMFPGNSLEELDFAFTIVDNVWSLRKEKFSEDGVWSKRLFNFSSSCSRLGNIGSKNEIFFNKK